MGKYSRFGKLNRKKIFSLFVIKLQHQQKKQNKQTNQSTNKQGNKKQ